MKRSILYFGLPFVLLVVSMLLIPNVQYGWPGSAVDAGIIGWLHLLFVVWFVGAVVWYMLSAIRK